MSTAGPDGQPISEGDILSRLRAGHVAVPPLVLTWTAAGRTHGCDAIAKVAWASESFRFLAEIKARSTPKVFAAAIAHARAMSRKTRDNPMVVLPYLAPEKLEQLEREQVSGIDLCGNALVVVPGKLFVLRTGNENKFKESFPIRDVYRGTTSLVARAMLLRSTASSLVDLDRFIQSRGGAVTLTTISKALRRMEDDVLIERKGGWARLLQPEALLDKLAAAFRPPRVRSRFVGSTGLDREAVGRCIADAKLSAVLSGQSSTDRYAVMGREDRISIYCRSIALAQNAFGSALKAGDRFANIELIETDDPGPYFDLRWSGAVPFASPIQTFLELAAGDKREQETAEQVRRLILSELQRPETRS
jgi:hypothetical protein